jgi:hypothetical protein
VANSAVLAARLMVVTPVKDPWWQQVTVTPRRGFFMGVFYLLIALPLWGSATDGRGHLLPWWLTATVAVLVTATGTFLLGAAVLLRRRRQAAVGGDEKQS